MKKITTFAAMYLVLTGCSTRFAADEYMITGTLETNGVPTTVILSYNYAYAPEGEKCSFTAEVKENKFEFRGTVEEPAMARLTIEKEGERSDVLSFFLEPGTMTVTAKDKLSEAAVSDTKAASDRKKWSEVSQGVTNPYREIGIQFIKDNPDSWIALLMIYEHAVGYTPEYEYANEVFNYFTPQVQNTPLGKRIQTKLGGWKATAVGQMAPDFTLNDINGNPVSLSDFHGQYVYLDFWASWCGACRADNPNVLKAFNELKGQNFTVLGVSVDNNNETGRARWKKAVEDDGMPWMQLINNDETRDEVANRYGISAVPTTFLLDPQGKIIAKNLRGEKLAELIGEYLK